MPAGAAGSQIQAGVVAREDVGQVGFDVLQREELFVQLVIAALAVPDHAVQLMRQALALDYQADAAGRAPWRVRHLSRQQEDFAGADRNVAHRAILLHLQHHLALQLVEPLRAFVVVVIGARVRPADHHHDEVTVVDHLVALRGLQQVAVFFDPGVQVDRRSEHDRFPLEVSRACPCAARRTAPYRRRAAALPARRRRCPFRARGRP
ncbi:hypothetical protein G6F24_016146 [Rhizopus arrhizus]|nr:hypothetical protein G6F24_016146 [Rhizopus arrhizus]